MGDNADIIQSSIDTADLYISPIIAAKDSGLQPDGFSEWIAFSNLTACGQVKIMQQKASGAISRYSGVLTVDLDNFKEIASTFAVQDELAARGIR